jgi:hypothetical protein
MEVLLERLSRRNRAPMNAFTRIKAEEGTYLMFYGSVSSSSRRSAKSDTTQDENLISFCFKTILIFDLED